MTNTLKEGDSIRQEDIPALYSTEKIELEEKLIFQRYHLPNPVRKNGMLYDSRGFNWFLAELDSSENTAFCWACLSDLQNAEWGYVYLPEIIDGGAVRDRNWIPLFFPEAKKLCYGYLERIGTKEHFDWWRYANHDGLKSEYERLWKSEKPFDLERFKEKVYRFQWDEGGF